MMPSDAGDQLFDKEIRLLLGEDTNMTSSQQASVRELKDDDVKQLLKDSVQLAHRVDPSILPQIRQGLDPGDDLTNLLDSCEWGTNIDQDGGMNNKMDVDDLEQIVNQYLCSNTMPDEDAEGSRMTTDQSEDSNMSGGVQEQICSTRQDFNTAAAAMTAAQQLQDLLENPQGLPLPSQIHFHACSAPSSPAKIPRNSLMSPSLAAPHTFTQPMAQSNLEGNMMFAPNFQTFRMNPSVAPQNVFAMSSISGQGGIPMGYASSQSIGGSTPIAMVPRPITSMHVGPNLNALTPSSFAQANLPIPQSLPNMSQLSIKSPVMRTHSGGFWDDVSSYGNSIGGSLSGSPAGSMDEFPFETVQSGPTQKDVQSLLPGGVYEVTDSNGHPGVSISLLNADLWAQFFVHTNEMVTSGRGRQMFPTIKLSVKGLKPEELYMVWVHFYCEDGEDEMWRYTEDRSWVKIQKQPGSRKLKHRAHKPSTSNPGDIYNHPSSPSPGSAWMGSTVNFNRVRLTNHQANNEHVYLKSFRMYTPVIYIAPVSGDPGTNLYSQPKDTMKFELPLARFITGTSYHNKSIVRLKIMANPMAKSQHKLLQAAETKKNDPESGKQNTGNGKSSGKNTNSHTEASTFRTAPQRPPQLSQQIRTPGGFQPVGPLPSPMVLAGMSTPTQFGGGLRSPSFPPPRNPGSTTQNARIFRSNTLVPPHDVSVFTFKTTNPSPLSSPNLAATPASAPVQNFMEWDYSEDHEDFQDPLASLGSFVNPYSTNTSEESPTTPSHDNEEEGGSTTQKQKIILKMGSDSEGSLRARRLSRKSINPPSQQTAEPHLRGNFPHRNRSSARQVNPTGNSNCRRASAAATRMILQDLRRQTLEKTCGNSVETNDKAPPASHGEGLYTGATADGAGVNLDAAGEKGGSYGNSNPCANSPQMKARGMTLRRCDSLEISGSRGLEEGDLSDSDDEIFDVTIRGKMGSVDDMEMCPGSRSMRMI